MTSLHFIQDLENHAGFVIDRLTCDGNVYACKINLGAAYDARAALAKAFLALRKSVIGIEEKYLTLEAVSTSIDDFNSEDWDD